MNILWTALITPFDSQGRLDFPSLSNLLQQQADAGNGVILSGSTGEGLALSDDERYALLDHAFSLKLKLPLMVGIPSTNLPQALAWVKRCQSFPLAGFLATTPIYTKPGIEGQKAWFQAILDASHAPVMLYNIPSRSGVRLHPQVIHDLWGHPQFWALKDSGGSIDSLVEYRLAAPDLKIFCGDDYLMPSMASEGACGLVSVASNLWPQAVRTYVQESLKGKTGLSATWWHACRSLFTAPNPVPCKALLHHLGQISTPNLRPPLTQADLKDLQVLLKAHQNIQAWEKAYV